MKMQRISSFICLLLLMLAIGGSACSFSKINAQNPNSEAIRANAEKTAESPTPSYKPQKRISKDVITEEKKETKIKVKAK